MKTAWKFLIEKDGKIVSKYDNSPWVIGGWGDALSYVSGSNASGEGRKPAPERTA